MSSLSLIALHVALPLAEGALAVVVLYLCTVTGAALVSHTPRRKAAVLAGDSSARQILPRMVLIIPAHNEETTIETLLDSLDTLTYPRDRLRIIVVADNCSDATAQVVRDHGGITVYARHDDQHRGKGYALMWMLDRLERDHLTFDAMIVVDADSVVPPEFIEPFAREILDGALAVQGRNLVLNAQESPSAALRWIALALMNYVRPMGRTALGGSSTLTGNGFCLARTLIQRHPWQAFGLAEDYQHYLHLVSHGVKVRYAPNAEVLSVMPTSFRQLTTQDIRWESAGSMARSWQWRMAWRLFVGGVRHHDLTRLDALAELLVPQLSMLGLWYLLLLPVTLLWGSAPERIGVILLALGLGMYVGSAFVLLRPPTQVYRALLYAPWFALRKAWIVLFARHQQRYTRTWVRTSRTAR